jgi:hypothetical protein
LESLGKEKVGLFHGHLEYIAAIWYISLPFGNLAAIWNISPCFGILCHEKSGNPDVGQSEARRRFLRNHSTKMNLAAKKPFGATFYLELVSVTNLECSRDVYFGPVPAKSNSRPHFPGIEQGCQIFLGTKYQNGENYTK